MRRTALLWVLFVCLQQNPANARQADASVLENFATWFSGIAYLNPRFGSGTRRPKADWESAKTASPTHVAPKSRYIDRESTVSGPSTKSMSQIPASSSNRPTSPEETSTLEMSGAGARPGTELHDTAQQKGRRQNRRSKMGAGKNRRNGRTRARGSVDPSIATASDNMGALEMRQPIAGSSSHLNLPAASTGMETQLPKIALMFLTRGNMPYEATWKHFLEGVPTKEEALQPSWTRLFTLYVHPSVNYSYPASSLFYGHAVDKREKVEWGQWSVMQAERNLIEAALADTLNERFALLSESCIPLYPGAVVWAQLLREPRSRIHACADLSNPQDADRRMTYRMQNMESDGLKKEHWRKSGQWIALNRKHAQLVVADTVISKLFKNECWVDSDHLAKGEPLWRFCVSDEHYVPTLLAFAGLEAETDCQGSVTNAWWDGPYFHPRTWEAAEVSLDLISKLRKTNNGFHPQENLVCDSADALKSARDMFPEKESSLTFLSQGERRQMLQVSEQATLSSMQRSGLRNQLDRRREPDSFWMHLAVLQPGSLVWWELLDDQGINGDVLLEEDDVRAEEAAGRQLSQEATVPWEQGAHWEAARVLLEKFRPMKDGGCPLFARKFAAHGAGDIAELARRYTSLERALAGSGAKQAAEDSN